MKLNIRLEDGRRSDKEQLYHAKIMQVERIKLEPTNGSMSSQKYKDGRKEEINRETCD
jgi:hypothetical protein